MASAVIEANQGDDLGAAAEEVEETEVEVTEATAE